MLHDCFVLKCHLVIFFAAAVLPFTVGVHFDADEEHTAIANGQTANSEAAVPPGTFSNYSK